MSCKNYDIHTKRGIHFLCVCISASVVTDKWEKINAAQENKIMAGRGADC